MAGAAVAASVVIVVTAAALAVAVFGQRRREPAMLGPELIPIQEVTAGERDEYLARWHAIMSASASNSLGAVRDADNLAREIMERQGFPMSDLIRRLREVPTEYADVTYMFRRAHALRVVAEEGASTDATIKSAMYYFRALFGFLLRERVQRLAKPLDASEPHT